MIKTIGLSFGIAVLTCVAACDHKPSQNASASAPAQTPHQQRTTPANLTVVSDTTLISPFAHPSEDPEIGLGDKAFELKEYAAAMQHFKKAEASNDPLIQAAASLRIAYLYIYALGVPANISEAFNRFKSLSESGDRIAQANLGHCYFDGVGTKRDFTLARQWFLASANQGVTFAMDQLGWLYLNGLGGATDFNGAMSWYQKSAELGDSDGLAQVASMYLYGRGVPKDLERAMALYKRSAELGSAVGEGQYGWMFVHVKNDYAEGMKWYLKADADGNESASNNIGYLYENGLGVPKDYAIAAHWYEKSVDRGFTRALFHLGSFYDQGLGVPKNPDKARMLMQQAAAGGDEEAAQWVAVHGGAASTN